MRATFALFLLLAAGSAAAGDKVKVAVFDFAANGVPKETPVPLVAMVAHRLEAQGIFKVLTQKDLRDMLSFEKSKAMLGCGDAACLAEIGGALGVDYLVTGGLNKVGTGMSLDLTLVNVKKAGREASQIISGKTDGEIASKLEEAVDKLTLKLRGEKSGFLVVTAAELGATVKVDDEIKGVLPLPGQLTLAGGPHKLEIEKKGFITFEKTIAIPPGGTTVESITMVPSPDFVKEYESKEKKMRLGAWLSTGLAVAGVGSGAMLQYFAGNNYDRAGATDTFVFYRSQLEKGVEKSPDGSIDYRAKANELKSKIESQQTFSYIGFGVGGAAAIAATYFWIAGEDPNRYAQFRGGAAMIDVVPTPGGAYASLTVGF